MAKVTPGFKLYLYQLLSRKLGVGKQTLLPQVEEALADDDILPQDLECDTVQELTEACSDFLKVTVFKKGRVYVTVLANKEWDQMLAEPPEAKPAGKKQKAKGPKTWKKKKSGKKSFKPVKPGKARRDREAREAAEEAERAAAEAAERAAQAAEAEAAERAAAAAAAEPSAEEAAAAEVSQIEAPASEASAAEQSAPAAEAAPTDEMQTIPAPPSEPRQTARTIAEILAESRAAEAQTAAQEAPAAAEVAPVPTDQASVAPTPQDQSTQEPATSTPIPTPVPEPVTAATSEPAPASIPTPVTADETGTPAEASTLPEAEPAPEPPAAPEPDPISLTITYDPYEDMERELARQQAASTLRPEPPKLLSEEPAPTPAMRIPLDGLPQDFGAEVSCKDALLRTLYQLLPYDVEPMTILDEDWRMARSTGSLSGSRNRVTFPLRYLHEDGSPLTVTLRKTTKNAFGKHWNLTLVDGDDGSGEPHTIVGIEGLPAADEGAWSDLAGSSSDNSTASPLRTLTQQVVIGTWERFLGSLAATAAPERWNYPGEGVGRASRYGILREYVATTFHRAQAQGRLAHSLDGSLATFNTGLLTPFGEDIFCCLTARTGDIPWKFAGFATMGSGELGGRLAATIANPPLPPSYLTSMDDVVVDTNRLVILDHEAILARQLGRLPRAFLAEQLEGNFAAEALLEAGAALSAADVRDLARIIRADAGTYRRMRRTLSDLVNQTMARVRTSYRDAVPAYDPADGRTKLLVPLSLVREGVVDCALVLDLQPSGAYRAGAVLSLPRAYACARVVSKEQPSWLAADHVL